jgi:hypothetical protein
MYGATGSVVGGGDTIVFGAAYDDVSLSNTGGNWDTVNKVSGVSGEVDLANAQAFVNGNSNTIAFVGAAGSAVSVTGTSDTFTFQAAFGHDTITGFDPATDHIN